MKKAELIRLKRLLQKEVDRRNRINELLSSDLIQEFLSLNKLDINKLEADDKWIILEELLKEFKITESNGILVCTACYTTDCTIYYQETEFYTSPISFDSNYVEHHAFKDIETGKICKAYSDRYIHNLVREENRNYPRSYISPSEFCHKRYGMYLVSELKERYTILNPHNSLENENGYKEVRKDFFTTAIEKGQTKAKQLVLSKYPQMK